MSYHIATEENHQYQLCPRGERVWFLHACGHTCSINGSTQALDSCKDTLSRMFWCSLIEVTNEAQLTHRLSPADTPQPLCLQKTNCTSVRGWEWGHFKPENKRPSHTHRHSAPHLGAHLLECRGRMLSLRLAWATVVGQA